MRVSRVYLAASDPFARSSGTAYLIRMAGPWGGGGFKHLNAPPPIDGFCPIEFLAKGMTASTLQPGEQLERVLAANLGLARTVLTGFRKENLERGADWRYEREVILTAKGTSSGRISP